MGFVYANTLYEIIDLKKMDIKEYKILRDFKKVLINNQEYIIENGSVILGEVISGAIGSIGLPILSNTILIYKQKRLEKNVNEFMNEVRREHQILEEKLAKFDQKKLDILSDSILPITLDYVLDETQKEKIKYYFNGFKKIILDGISFYNVNEQIDVESLIILYLDILRQLTVFDILLLGEIATYVHNESKEKEKLRIIDREDLLEVTRKYSVEKLKDLRIIMKPTTIGEMSAEGEYTFNIEDISLTAIGDKFYHFIKK